MNHSADDPDDLVRKKLDLNHITKMSKQINLSSIEQSILILGHHMQVPDSITLGPNRSAVPRFNQDNDRLPVRMEVPDSIRLGKTKNQDHFFSKVFS
jgi:hypothetical protein